MSIDAALQAAWCARVAAARAALGWPPADPSVVRHHARGVTLSLAAPVDQLLTATDVNEWALCASFAEREPARWRAMLEAQSTPPDVDAAPASEPSIVDCYLDRGRGSAFEHGQFDDAVALAHLRDRAAREASPALRALVGAASERGLQYLLDDSQLTLGAGGTSHSFALDELPTVSAVRWQQLGSVPTALVTGSNGKTTTVRLIAAMLEAHGLRTGHSSTDGVTVAGVVQLGGDYSGPIGARTVLRHPDVEAAVLETARGGILRRGLAVERAEVAVVTNVSADHFGEFGIDDLTALAGVKLAVVRALRPGGTLVVNADDPLLRDAAVTANAWFALDADAPLLAACRARGGSSCGLRDGHLVLHVAGTTHDLGAVAAMPLTFSGSARHNVSNLAAAALAAAALGVAPATISGVARSFGADPNDNSGRLMHFERGGVHAVVDYAHNPDGLRNLRPVIEDLRGRGLHRGRLALLLGHAGNRMDAEIANVAATAAELGPDLVVVKEVQGMLRGRAAGEVAARLQRTLLDLGFAPDAVVVELDEVEAARRALAWARPGDVVLLLVHARFARDQVLKLLRS